MWTLSCDTWDLVPWPGIEPRSPALGAWSLSHWAREVPRAVSMGNSYDGPCVLKVYYVDEPTRLFTLFHVFWQFKLNKVSPLALLTRGLSHSLWGFVLGAVRGSVAFLAPSIQCQEPSPQWWHSQLWHGGPLGQNPHPQLRNTDLPLQTSCPFTNFKIRSSGRAFQVSLQLLQ